MHIVTKEEWMRAFLSQQQGGRFNQLLSILSGGQIKIVQWLSDLPEDAEHQAVYLQSALRQAQIESQFVIAQNSWQSAGLLQMNDGRTGIVVVMAYAVQEDFQQVQLQAALQWLQQMTQLNAFPIRLVLLAFSRVPDIPDEQPDMLESWQWEELLESGVQFATGQSAHIAEVMILPITAYPNWLQ